MKSTAFEPLYYNSNEPSNQNKLTYASFKTTFGMANYVL